MADDNMTLEDFAGKLLEDKGLKNLDPEVKKEMIDDLLNRLNDQINASLIETLPEDKVSDLNKLLDDEKTPDDAAQKFFAENVDDFQNTFTAILTKFRQTYLGL